MVTNINRFDVLLIPLDPTIGSELKKTGPCLVVSPNSMNLSRLNTIIVAPMTSTIRQGPTRVTVEFQKKQGQVALEQLRVIDRTRILKKVGALTDTTTQTVVLKTLQTMFQ